jgi:predicted nucleotidyltransferase
MLMLELIDHVKKAGFSFTDSLIHLFVGGSALHGAKSGDGLEDLDIYGVFVEPPTVALGIDCFEHFCWSTSGNERKNVAGDVDITLYSLRKWASLAAKGNPTSLHFLTAENTLPCYYMSNWGLLTDYKRLFYSKVAAKQFLGFADAQLGRLEGRIGAGKHGQRPELIGKYGYDTKAGMHVIRLLSECIELMTEHRITLPRPEKDLLIHIRNGGWSLDKLIEESKKLFVKAKEAMAASTLPDTVDRTRISALVAECYQKQWKVSLGK